MVGRVVIVLSVVEHCGAGCPWALRAIGRVVLHPKIERADIALYILYAKSELVDCAIGEGYHAVVYHILIDVEWVIGIKKTLLYTGPLQYIIRIIDMGIERTGMFKAEPLKNRLIDRCAVEQQLDGMYAV